MSQPLEIGEFRWLVTWQKSQTTTNNLGTQVSSWVSQGSFWAKITPLRGWASYIAQAQTAGATLELRILTDAIISPGSRLTIDGTNRVLKVVTSFRAMDQIDAILIVTASEDTNP